MNHNFMSAWGAPQQAQLLDERFCFIFQCLYQEKSNVLKGANCPVSNKARTVSARLPTDPLANSNLGANRLLRKALYNGLQYKYWTWARFESSCNHVCNAALDVSASGAAVASNKESLMMHWVIVGILSGAMSYNIFK